MKLKDHLFNASKIEINVYDLNTEDWENEFITGYTRFDYTLTININGAVCEYKDQGDWVCDWCTKYEGMNFEESKGELKGDLTRKIINHILDLES